MSVQSEKPQLFSNWFEVHSMHHLLSNNKLRWHDDGTDNFLDSTVKTVNEFERAISDADAFIIARLANRYTEAQLRGGTQTLNKTLHLFGPIGKQEDGTKNVGGDLIHVTVNNTTNVYTAVWKLTYTDDLGKYLIYSFLEGAQGSGENDIDGSSTNEDITINASYWENTAQTTGDIYWFSVSRAYKIINTISKTLAAAFLLNEITGDQTSEDSVVGRRMYSRAIAWIELLRNGGMALDAENQPEIDESVVEMPYWIDRYGDSSETRTR